MASLVKMEAIQREKGTTVIAVAYAFQITKE